MSSSLRRGALAAAVTVLTIAPLSACGAGSDAQTLEIKPDNAAVSVGDIKIQNVTVVTQPDLKAKGPAVVTGKLFNNGRRDQTLRAIRLPGTHADVTLSPAKGSGPVVVPAGGSIVLGGEGNPSAVVEDGREAAKDGDAQPIVFDFSSTGDVALRAFVVPAKGYFAEWGPEVAASTSAGPSTSPSGGEGGGSESGSESIAPGEHSPGE
ncbi:DUF461 domain-containing protein [Streptomyces sp. B1866]|uniref:DUF461 domain-containing protein n=1 Tax=Streptomyces sp. B1866 TaxID=3075431 RepID=UPI00288E78F2|nr:DUF461 domain-containing protein [Streptomyces sp. B1866]MDT3399442.1 DUF461 domain-containing protein [Streptomyces sp. B1866]